MTKRRAPRWPELPTPACPLSPQVSDKRTKREVIVTPTHAWFAAAISTAIFHLVSAS
jgi:hypothetical protein